MTLYRILQADSAAVLANYEASSPEEALEMYHRGDVAFIRGVGILDGPRKYARPYAGFRVVEVTEPPHDGRRLDVDPPTKD